MRPVSQERRTPRPRTAGAVRSPSRGVSRGPAPSAGNRRGKSGGGIVLRVLRFFLGLINFRHPMVVVTTAVVILTLAGAVIAGRVVERAVDNTNTAAGAAASQAGFGVAQVHLGGNARTSPAEIMTALGLMPGQSIFGIDLHQARERLMALPWVADADVRRRYPDDISVQIAERVPFARWQAPNGLFVVERDGRPIVPLTTEKFEKLPLLLGDVVPDKASVLLAAVARHRAIAARVRGYQYVSRRRWNLLLDDGVVVKLPENGFERQLDVLDKLIVEKGVLEADIQEIDLRDPNYFYFKRSNGAEQQKDRKAESGSAI